MGEGVVEGDDVVRVPVVLGRVEAVVEREKLVDELSPFPAVADGNRLDRDEAEPHEVEDRIYDSIELEEMDYVEEDGMYYYQCPCGDMFEISEVCARAPPPLS